MLPVVASECSYSKYSSYLRVSDSKLLILVEKTVFILTPAPLVWGSGGRAGLFPTGNLSNLYKFIFHLCSYAH